MIRRNWSVFLNRDKGAIAPDDVCEKINLWTKLLPFTPYMERLVKKTEHLSLARRCGFEIHDGYDVKSSTAPKREEAFERLYNFFERCELFHDAERGRVLQNNSFWDFVNLNREKETNPSDREKETVPLSAYEEELENIFFTMKASDAVISPNESNLGVDDDEEPEDADDGEDIENVVEEDLNNNEAAETIETEDERIAALKKLSNVKKYEVSQLAIRDLDVIGREMLGPNLKETRLQQREDRQKRIAQIHEAVDHFQATAKIRRENLAASAGPEVGTVCECSWELDYVDILFKN